MKIPAKKAGTASVKSSQSISLNADNIIIPTATKAQLVAADGIALTSGAANALKPNMTQTTQLVKPVFPPAPIPAALSTKVVVLLVPTIAPMLVAILSANNALSILDLNPLDISIAFSSSAEKMPDFLPVPINVPNVSKVSDNENDNIVMKTRGNLAGSLNSETIPSPVKITPKVEGRALQASTKLIELPNDVTPKGIPAKVVCEKLGIDYVKVGRIKEIIGIHLVKLGLNPEQVFAGEDLPDSFWLQNGIKPPFKLNKKKKIED